ncbi:hypothetical protein [Citrobacter werkmanii]|uniref:hypothetical protein n=2 Tax=Citrobacter werkmanii TaxID=67827 RepID=UPI00388EA5D8
MKYAELKMQLAIFGLLKRKDALRLYYFVTCLWGFAELTNTLLPYGDNLTLTSLLHGIQTD